MEGITGVSGELVDRLLEAINSPVGEDCLQFGWELVFCVGGKELDDVEPYVPGGPATTSDGAGTSQKLPLVGREEFFSLLRRRLLELIDSGVREDFLVRALRDDLSAALQALSWPNEVRNWFDDVAPTGDDDVLRPRFSEPDPMTPARSISHQQLGEAWAREDRWQRRAKVVGDEVLARWLDETARRAAD